MFCTLLPQFLLPGIASPHITTQLEFTLNILPFCGAFYSAPSHSLMYWTALFGQLLGQWTPEPWAHVLCGHGGCLLDVRGVP